MTPTHTRIIDAFKENHYLTSSQLVQIAGYRYSARLHELRKMGYSFPWGFKKDIKGNKTNTTISDDVELEEYEIDNNIIRG